jgi:iron-sulfur cluster repair protein YtfE (RIC family)
MTDTFAAIPPVAERLLADPLEWFAAEHQRHRQFCLLMHGLAAERSFRAEPVAALVDFLRHELGRHLADEEEDLFPLLRKRALAEDQVDDVLRRLRAEHRGDLAHGGALRAHLERCLETRTAPGADAAVALALDAFASQELNHLALENAVLLPLARLRLAAADLVWLSGRLAARRGAAAEPAPADVRP